jgi:hypothetical protein
MDASNAFWEAVDANYESQVGEKDWEAAENAVAINSAGTPSDLKMAMDTA